MIGSGHIPRCRRSARGCLLSSSKTAKTSAAATFLSLAAGDRICE
jgi:hypothetical protein